MWLENDATNTRPGGVLDGVQQVGADFGLGLGKAGTVALVESESSRSMPCLAKRLMAA